MIKINAEISLEERERISKEGITYLLHQQLSDEYETWEDIRSQLKQIMLMDDVWLGSRLRSILNKGIDER